MGTGTLETAFHRSLSEPAGFWGEAAEAVYWYKRWDKVLDDSRQPFYRWFVGGEVNTCYNALDLHVDEGHGEQPALVYDSPVTNSIQTFTYRQLRDKVVAMILEGTLGEGDALPSVRSVAAEHTLNPLTVLKGYQQLVDEGLVEKRRGRGMFVTTGARSALLRGERERFLEQEWPRVLSTIDRLGLDVQALLKKGDRG